MVTIETCVSAVSCWVETLNLNPREAIQTEEVDSIQIQISSAASRWPGFDVESRVIFAYFCGDK